MAPDLPAAYANHAFTQMLAAADRAGDRLDERPFGPTTTAIGALIAHCCGVVEFWVGHVALGRPSDRDREAEFSAVVPLADLHRTVGSTVAQLGIDLAALAAGDGTPSGARGALVGDGSDDSIVLHVLEELFQHLGQIELTLDALGQPRIAE